MSFEEHDLHMLAASWQLDSQSLGYADATSEAAGSGLDASGLSLRVILTPPQDVGGDHIQSHTSSCRCCRSVPERRAMSVVEGSEELERPPRRTPTLCLMSTVVLGDAQHLGSCLFFGRRLGAV